MRISSPLLDEHVSGLIAQYRTIEAAWKDWGVKKAADLIVKSPHESGILEAYRGKVAKAEQEIALHIKKQFK